MTKAKSVLIQGIVLAMAAAAIPGVAAWRSATLSHEEIMLKQTSDAALRQRELDIEEAKARSEQCRTALGYLEDEKANPFLERRERRELASLMKHYATQCFAIRAFGGRPVQRSTKGQAGTPPAR